MEENNKRIGEFHEQYAQFFAFVGGCSQSTWYISKIRVQALEAN